MGSYSSMKEALMSRASCSNKASLTSMRMVSALGNLHCRTLPANVHCTFATSDIHRSMREKIGIRTTPYNSKKDVRGLQGLCDHAHHICILTDVQNTRLLQVE